MEGGRAGSGPQSFDQEGYIWQGRTKRGIFVAVGFQSIFLATCPDGELCLTRYHEDTSAVRLRSYIHLYLSVNLNHISLPKIKPNKANHEQTNKFFFFKNITITFFMRKKN